MILTYIISLLVIRIIEMGNLLDLPSLNMPFACYIECSLKMHIFVIKKCFIPHFENNKFFKLCLGHGLVHNVTFWYFSRKHPTIKHRLGYQF